MTLHLDIFEHKFEQAQQQLTELVQQTGSTSQTQPLMAKALEELSNVLEEVHVLTEELSEQHSQLQIAQLTVAIEQQQYFDLFNLAPEGYLVTDAQGIIEQVNQTAVTLLNRSQPLLIGKPLAALVAPVDLHRFYTLLTRLQQGEAIQTIDLYLKSYQKQAFYSSFTIAPRYDHRRQLVGFFYLFRDLTQSRRAALALEESEAKYRAIVEDQTELICQSMADGRIMFVNQAFLQYFNRSSESLIGSHFFSLIQDSDQDKVAKALASLDRSHPVITLNHRVVMSDGQICWQQWVHRALFDTDGDFFQFQSTGRDITAQVQAEESLQQREAQLRLVTEALPVLIAYVNTRQQLIYVNHTHEHWLGQPCTDMVEQYLWDVLGPTPYQQIRFPVEAALSGEHVTVEQEVTLPDHKPFWISITLVPDQSEEGNVKGFCALVNDISDRKAMEYQKDQFISIVSHELRTPLTSIQGALKLLTQDALDPRSTEGKNLLTIANNNTEHMVTLVNDLLDWQQIKLGKLTLFQHSCPADFLIQNAINMLESMAQEHHITLKTVPCKMSVWADPERIVQVLANLISNAIKFSPAGSTVSIMAGQAVNPRLPSSSIHSKFQVCDQGQGISADNLELIFEAFHQVDGSDARRRGGTGLGLGICRSIIEQHGGSMRVESALGSGTTVSFTLPYDKLSS